MRSKISAPAVISNSLCPGGDGGKGRRGIKGVGREEVWK